MASELGAFRDVARGLLARGVPPERVTFEDAPGPWEGAVDPGGLEGTSARVLPVLPWDFLGLAEKVVCHRAPERWGLLYRVLWRMTRGERRLLEREGDLDVQRLRRMERAVRRDVSNLVIRVRFRREMLDGAERHVAWYRPDHRVVRLAAPFLVGRFPTLCWSLFTPDTSAHWDGVRLTFGAGLRWEDPPGGMEPSSSPAARVERRTWARGGARTPVMLLGDVPGTWEEGRGVCFVGPAGKFLEVVLARAGLRRTDLRVSQEARSGGHDEPLDWRDAWSRRERLASEVTEARPLLLLALGRVAGQMLWGPGFRLALCRGRLVQMPSGAVAMATFAPSEVLRPGDIREQAELRIHFEADLRSAADALRRTLVAQAESARACNDINARE
ncbi:DUF4130 domain-containing protein [Myxococcus landrumensis]|uniref:DUF4130 domain-containing protein n=1 Tax=Myxococcus landrumensis TaxID=2813577 RepID=A0ABX7NH37_9BACT|nr:DUF4130 domain-containing protein [Myxococcus landrumus]